MIESISANLIINTETYSNDEAIENTVNYISRLNNENIFYYGIWPPCKETAIRLYENLRLCYSDHIDNQKVQHFWITYGDLSDMAFINTFANKIAYLLAQEYPICFASHDDKKHWHTHFVVSTTSYYPNYPPLVNKTWNMYLHNISSLAESHGVLLKIM